MEMKWAGRIKEAERRGHFSHEDKDLVNSWRTCQVGELAGRPDDYRFPFQAQVIERDHEAGLLYDMGHMFMHAVNTDDPVRAAELATRIKGQYKKVASQVKAGPPRNEAA